MYGLTRGMFTLIGAAGVAVLFWLASQLDTGTTGGYWAWAGLLAAAGLAVPLSQLLGGWTKWGWPRISGSVFLLGFVPAFVVGLLVLLRAQPDSGSVGTGWAGSLGVGGVAGDLAASVLPAIAFGLGLVFGLTFDTTGPRVRTIAHDEPLPVIDRAVDEPLVSGDEPAGPAGTDEDVTREGEGAHLGSDATPPEDGPEPAPGDPPGPETSR